jgi:RNA polymerase sigma factor (sigma-70 family)
MTRSDARLLKAARRDPAAFRELYERHVSRVHGYCMNRCRNTEAAHDLTAETFARAWLLRERFEDRAGGSAAPWLLGIARRVLLESVEKGRLERTACIRLGVLEALDRPPATAAPDRSWIDGIDEAMAALPESQRTAVALRVLGDLDYAGVADALGTSPQAARVRVHRGLAALRNHLSHVLEATR